MKNLIRINIFVFLFLFSSNLQARAFIVSWKANPVTDRVTEYRTYRNDSLIYTGVDTFCVDTTLENGIEYWYSIQAVNAYGASFISAPVYGMWIAWDWDWETEADSLQVVINMNADGLYMFDVPPGDRWVISIEKDLVTMRSTWDLNGDGVITLSDFGSLTDDDIIYVGDFIVLYGKPCIWTGERR